LEVLSEFSWLRNDPRLKEISDIVKADNEGKYTPESEWKAWKGWEFRQKKKPIQHVPSPSPVAAITRFSMAMRVSMACQRGETF